MAVKKVSPAKHEYTQSSFEDRPGTPPEGSTVHFFNTGEMYVYHDGTWEPDLRLARAIKMASEMAL